MISFPVLPASLAVLCWLTLFLGASNAENGSCIYSAKIDPSEDYYIHNHEYPGTYEEEGFCMWSLRSAYKIEINCTLNMLRTKDCSKDRLSIRPRLYVWQRYCGHKSFRVVADDPSVSVLVRWSSGFRGTYFCTATALQDQPHQTDDTILSNGSVEARVNEFPMMCALVDFQIKLPFCGCTIIHNKYVLTAAQCLLNRTLSNIGVLVGDHDYSTSSDTNASWIYGVEKGISHPYFELGIETDDIAVIQVKGWMHFDERVAPVYLPFQHSSDTFGGERVTALGWGPTKFGGVLSKTLQKLGMIVQTTEECRIAYPTVDGDHICTYRRNKNTCGMQSGGPVLWRNQISRNFVLVGVMSYGFNCTRVDSVNPRVGPHIPWITSVSPDANYSSIE